VDKKFSKGSLAEKGKVATVVAHGYYMGARHYENLANRPFWKFWVKQKLTVDELDLESVDAANEYIKKKNFYKLPYYEQALLRASVSMGFKEGFKSRATAKA
jgi:hypothetical protein